MSEAINAPAAQETQWMENELITERGPFTDLPKVILTPEQIDRNRAAHAKYATPVNVDLIDPPQGFEQISPEKAEELQTQLRSVLESSAEPLAVIDSIPADISDSPNCQVALEPGSAEPLASPHPLDMDGPAWDPAMVDTVDIKRNNSSISGAFVSMNSPLFTEKPTLTATARQKRLEEEYVRKKQETGDIRGEKGDLVRPDTRTTTYSRQRDMSLGAIKTKLQLLINKATDNALMIKDPEAKVETDPTAYGLQAEQLIKQMSDRSNQLLASELQWGKANATTHHTDLMDGILSFSRILNLRDDLLNKEIRAKKRAQ